MTIRLKIARAKDHPAKVTLGVNYATDDSDTVRIRNISMEIYDILRGIVDEVGDDGIKGVK